MTDITLTEADAARIAAIQATLMEALRDSQAAHQDALAAILSLRQANADLEAKVTALEARPSPIEAGAVLPALDTLAAAVAAIRAALAPTPAEAPTPVVPSAVVPVADAPSADAPAALPEPVAPAPVLMPVVGTL